MFRPARPRYGKGHPRSAVDHTTAVCRGHKPGHQPDQATPGPGELSRGIAQGLFFVIAATPLALASASSSVPGGVPLPAVLTSTVLFLLAAILFPRRVHVARACTGAAIACGFISAIPLPAVSPQAALLAWIAMVSVAFAITRSALRASRGRPGDAGLPLTLLSTGFRIATHQRQPAI